MLDSWKTVSHIYLKKLKKGEYLSRIREPTIQTNSWLIGFRHVIKWFELLHSRLITEFVTRLTRRMPLVEHELLTLPEHLNSPPGFWWARVTRSLVFYVCFVDRCLSFCTSYFGHCVVCSSSIYRLWLPLWYLQTLLTQWLLSLYLVIISKLFGTLLPKII